MEGDLRILDRVSLVELRTGVPVHLSDSMHPRSPADRLNSACSPFAR